METRDPFKRSPSGKGALSRPGVRAALIVGAGLIGALTLSSLAPAFVDPPERPAFAERALSREWRGHRPDLNFDHMFRKDMPRQKSFQDAFRRPR